MVGDDIGLLEKHCRLAAGGCCILDLVPIFMNERLKLLAESATLKIADRVRLLKVKGRRVLPLQTGDPDFDTHPIVVGEALRSLKSGETHYSNTRGLPELRKAISADIWRRNKLDFNPNSEIIVTHGGIHAVFAALFALLNAGDEVLIEDPCWMPYVGCTLLAGGKVRRFSADSQNGFRFSITNLERELSPHSRVLILNSPCNPTGRIVDHGTLSLIADLVIRHDLWVISDEVYSSLIYDDFTHLPVAAISKLRERVITVGSMSKTYAMTGWRIGYAVGPNEIIDQMLKISQYTITNVAPFVQRAAVVALTSGEVAGYQTNMLSEYAMRRRTISDELSHFSSITGRPPDGGFYFLIDISRSGLDSFTFASRLLEEYDVAVVPGGVFGNTADSCIRITFAAALEEVLEGLRRINGFIDQLLIKKN